MERFETYGKINPIRKLILDFKSAFRINQRSRDLLKENGMDAYLPRLKKRFYLAAGISLFMASPAVPGGVVAVYPLMKWGLK